MHGQEIFTLGLGLTPPWEVVSQHLDTDRQPHELQLEVSADRGSEFPCPDCGKMCKAHDFKVLKWRHLNFFQHHCLITAKVPRVRCPEHGVKRIQVPWARKGSRFTLLFEQVVLSLVREMPVSAAARLVGERDKRLWRIIKHYVQQALESLDLSELAAFGFDETASRRGHNYVTVFVDMKRSKQPVVFATPGKGKATVKKFKAWLETHGGSVDNVTEVVCDMSPAFLAAVRDEFGEANVTVDWFHVVQLFTGAVDEVRKMEQRQHKLPKATRWAVLKGNGLTAKQKQALAELEHGDFLTTIAWRIKEKLRWIRAAATPRAAMWRMTHFLKYARTMLTDASELEPVRKALNTLQTHMGRILQRWQSTYTNARMEGLNSLFQAARARARGYRNDETFILMIYMIAAPMKFIFKST